MDLLKLIEQTAEGLGYELVDFETSPRGRLMRVFIDSPNGNGQPVAQHQKTDLAHFFGLYNRVAIHQIHGISTLAHAIQTKAAYHRHQQKHGTDERRDLGRNFQLIHTTEVCRSYRSRAVPLELSRHLPEGLDPTARVLIGRLGGVPAVASTPAQRWRRASPPSSA